MGDIRPALAQKLFHAGHANEETIALDQVYDQGIWAGSRAHLIDPFNLGRYLVKVYDAAGGTLIFSKGFDSYFGEYKTSDPALQGVRRTYHESALLPYPRKPVRFTVEAKDRQNAYTLLFSQVVDPAAMTVIREALVPGVKVFEVLKSGDPRRKADVAILAGVVSGTLQLHLREIPLLLPLPHHLLVRDHLVAPATRRSRRTRTTRACSRPSASWSAGAGSCCGSSRSPFPRRAPRASSRCSRSASRPARA